MREETYQRLIRWRDIGDDPDGGFMAGGKSFGDAVIELLAEVDRLRALTAVPDDLRAVAVRAACRDDMVRWGREDCACTWPECRCGTAPVAIADAILARVVPAVRAEERERIAAALDEEAANTPCSEDATVARDCAALVRADFSYEEAERLVEERPPTQPAASDSKEVMSRVGRTLLAVELQHGTQRSCAVAYAMLIAAHAASGREVWWPINEAVAQRFGPGGRERVKEAAWAIHDAAVEEQERQMPAAGGVG